MNYGRTFLVVAWIASLEVVCECCDENECSNWKTEEDCEDYLWFTDFPARWCSWLGGMCSEVTCANFSSSGDTCGATFSCVYSESTCRTVSQCSDILLEDFCLDGGWTDSFGPCDWIGGICKALNCADYGEDDCEFIEADAVGHCRVSEGVCSQTTSCGDWTDRPSDCNRKEYQNTDLNHFRYVYCVFSDGVCRRSVCADYNSDSEKCLSNHCKFAEGGCIASTSCSDWSETNNFFCETDPNLHCVWNRTTSTCAPFLACGEDYDRDDCESAGCFYLDGCPTPSPSPSPSLPSSAVSIFAPAFWITSILTLLMIIIIY